MAIQNCIASKYVLVRRGILPDELDICPFCSFGNESPNHLLLLCQWAWRVWSAIMDWWGFVWVSPPTILALFQLWNNVRFRNLERILWLASFYAVVWTIWTSRNDKVFNNRAVEVMDIIELSKVRMAMWVKGKYDIKDYSIDDFLRCLEGIRKVKIWESLCACRDKGGWFTWISEILISSCSWFWSAQSVLVSASMDWIWSLSELKK